MKKMFHLQRLVVLMFGLIFVMQDGRNPARQAIFGDRILERITPDNVAQIQQLAVYDQGDVCVATFSPRSSLLAASRGGEIALLDIAKNTDVRTLATEHRAVSSVVFSADGTRVAATSTTDCGDTSVRVWDVATGAMIFEGLRDFGHMAAGVAFSPDGDLLAVGTGCAFNIPGSASVKVWDLETGAQVFDLAMPSFVSDLAFSPDGSLLAVASSDGVVRLLNTTVGNVQAELYGGHSYLSSLAFSADGTRLVSAGEHTRLWDIAALQPLFRLGEPAGAVNAVAFSADGKLLVTGDSSHALAFRDAATGDTLALQEAGPFGNAVYSVSFNADNTMLATCGHDHMLRLWGVEQQWRF
jgi:WD40 repeat protein